VTVRPPEAGEGLVSDMGSGEDEDPGNGVVVTVMPPEAGGLVPDAEYD